MKKVPAIPVYEVDGDFFNAPNSLVQPNNEEVGSLSTYETDRNSLGPSTPKAINHFQSASSNIHPDVFNGLLRKLGPFHCSFCGKEFKRKELMLRHEQIHTDTRPFHCEECGKNFRHKRCLTQHLRIHTDEKPFSCVYCGTAYRQKVNLTIHVRAHTGERPYECSACRSKFIKRYDFTLHARKEHPGKTVPYILHRKDGVILGTPENVPPNNQCVPDLPQRYTEGSVIYQEHQYQTSPSSGPQTVGFDQTDGHRNGNSNANVMPVNEPSAKVALLSNVEQQQMSVIPPVPVTSTPEPQSSSALISTQYTPAAQPILLQSPHLHSAVYSNQQMTSSCPPHRMPSANKNHPIVAQPMLPASAYTHPEVFSSQRVTSPCSTQHDQVSSPNNNCPTAAQSEPLPPSFNHYSTLSMDQQIISPSPLHYHQLSITNEKHALVAELVASPSSPIHSSVPPLQQMVSASIVEHHQVPPMYNYMTEAQSVLLSSSDSYTTVSFDQQVTSLVTPENHKVSLSDYDYITEAQSVLLSSSDSCPTVSFDQQVISPVTPEDHKVLLSDYDFMKEAQLVLPSSLDSSPTVSFDQQVTSPVTTEDHKVSLSDYYYITEAQSVLLSL